MLLEHVPSIVFTGIRLQTPTFVRFFWEGWGGGCFGNADSSKCVNLRINNSIKDLNFYNWIRSGGVIILIRLQAE